MDWNKVRRYFTKQEDLTDEEIGELSKEFVPNASNSPAAAVGNQTQVADSDALRALLEKSLQESETLRKLLEDEKSDKEKRAMAMQEQLKRDAAKKKQDVIEKLVKASVLAPADEESKKNWEAILESNYESASVLAEKQIAAVRSTARVGETQSTSTPQPSPNADRAQLIEQAKSVFKK